MFQEGFEFIYFLLASPCCPPSVAAAGSNSASIVMKQLPANGTALCLELLSVIRVWYIDCYQLCIRHKEVKPVWEVISEAWAWSKHTDIMMAITTIESSDNFTITLRTEPLAAAFFRSQQSRLAAAPERSGASSEKKPWWMMRYVWDHIPFLSIFKISQFQLPLRWWNIFSQDLLVSGESISLSTRCWFHRRASLKVRCCFQHLLPPPGMLLIRRPQKLRFGSTCVFLSWFWATGDVFSTLRSAVVNILQFRNEVFM